MEKLQDRFLRYVSVDTQSDENSESQPSSGKQLDLLRMLCAELNAMGVSATLDEFGYVMGTLPSNIDREVPKLGFIAHVDTSPDASGANVKPQVILDYDGSDVPLRGVEGLYLKPDEFPELLDHKGETLITTDGTTLLGADDKAGVAEIMSAVEYLVEHPEIRHGDIKIGFTPDEEIGRGVVKFDVKKFGAKYAYTMDGGEIGELEYENFNAASAKITFKGLNVHPGAAKHKMLNSMRVALQFATMLPRWETPEHTEGYEGFYHLISMQGSVEQTTLSYIIRDHDRARFESRKREIEHLCRKINCEFPDCASCEIKDQYYNMREKIEPVMNIIEIAKQAMENAGVTPKVQPIRGGTDGAQLSFKNLPCPNIFAGGMNMHGRFEYVPIPSMEKAMNTIIEICKIVAE